MSLTIPIFGMRKDDLELVTFRIKQVVGLFLYLPAHALDGWVNVELLSANKEVMVEEVGFVISGREEEFRLDFCAELEVKIEEWRRGAGIG